MKRSAHIFFTLSLCTALAAAGCDKLQGDNSEYDFSLDNSEYREPIYENGFGRLDNSVRIATYNVHRCSPANNQINYANTARVIDLIDADVIALQELDNGANKQQLEELMKVLEERGSKLTYSHFAKADFVNNVDYGIGIIARREPLRIDSQPLPGNKEMRRFIAAEFDDYIFIATHFCNDSGDNRQASVRQITAYVEENFGDTTKPVFLAGDLNESNPNAVTFTLLEANWKCLTVGNFTHTNSSGEASRIDYVYVYTTNGADYVRLGSAVPTYENINLYTVSDHLPVFVDLEAFGTDKADSDTGADENDNTTEED